MGEASTRVCTFRWDEREGLVRATMHEGAVFELADAKEAVEVTCRVANGIRTRVLVDMRGVRSETREAREHFASAETAARLSAVALLVSSPLSRMIANFFLRISNLRIPTRMFDDEAAALAWLRTIPS